MPETQCANGHPIPDGQLECPECGAGPAAASPVGTSAASPGQPVAAAAGNAAPGTQPDPQAQPYPPGYGAAPYPQAQPDPQAQPYPPGYGAAPYPQAQPYPPGYGAAAYPQAQPYPGAGGGYGGPGFPGPAPGFVASGPPQLVLPSGVTLAPVGRRIGAFFLSIVLWLVTLYIGYVIWGIITWAQGQTPTQRVLGMRCYRPDTGRAATWGQMALREIVGGIVQNLFFPIVAIVSFVLMLTRPDRRCIADLVGSTVVVHDPDKVLQPAR